MIRHRIVLPAILAVIATAQLQAQAIPFSQHGTVSQKIGVTDVALSYNRPIARGRQLFPGVVHWGRTWNPGADSATRITFSKPVSVEGHPVPAGSYSIWLVPAEHGPWRLILNRAAAVFHTPYPGPESEQVAFPVAPIGVDSVDSVDTLEFSFPMVRPDHAILRFQWGDTRIDLRIAAPLPGN